ncbi:MAG: lysine-2,3-aminomutase-like protein [Hyphomonas sp.]|uniref:lysine-2,3-aminomutase-like protein n=1 Tax=Hyphomonas sp. TaxID=87 RepID=UPI0025C0256D|nr:lysine-2,3-aminomutase-like protein [Hyphomonas sp.]MBA4340012.1 lysine-2,3-aminomutase-like protein [Hyphomonas sp.]
MTVATLRSVAALKAAGLVSDALAPQLAAVEAAYAIALPEPLARAINRSNPADSIRRQYVPSPEELDIRAGESGDPIGDARHSPVPGLVHRYPDRVLIKATSTCPVYCRFCFRREMVGPEKGESLTRTDLDNIFAYIQSHPEIFEVILTGGDPLMLSVARAREITQRLEDIAHVKVIRWHTRMPVTRPDRITPAYAEALSSRKKAIFLAVHANHASEFTAEAIAACRLLAEQGIALVSQSVLLRGVNDTIEDLSDLMRAFLSVGIKPYYLHQLDAAPGTAHFRVPVAEGQRLVRTLRDNLSGLAVPHYVLDIPGGVSKASLALPDIERRDDTWAVRGRDGGIYPLTDD